MNTRKKISKILSIAIALIMIVTSVFAGIGTAGISEVIAAGEKQNVTELEVNIDWKKIPSLTVGQEIGKDLANITAIPEDAFTITSSAGINTENVEYYWAVKATPEHLANGYIAQETYDIMVGTYNSICPLFYYDAAYKISEDDVYYCYAYVTAADGYVFGDKEGENITDILKTNATGSFVLTDSAIKAAVFAGLGTPSQIENNKNGSSGGSSTPSQKQTVTELGVNIDWKKIPSLTVGQEIGKQAANITAIPEDVFTITSSTGINTETFKYYWAVKVTPEHLANGYIDQAKYDYMVGTFNSICPLLYYDAAYKISEDDIYYCWVHMEAADGYVFSDKNGDNITSILKTNATGSFVLSDGSSSNPGVYAVLLAGLGTPSQIENNKNGSAGGSGNVSVDTSIGAGAPDASLDIEKDELITILPDDIKAAINNGDLIDINLRVELQPVQGLTDTQKNAIADKKGDYTLTDDSYVDISLMKSINGGTATAITDVLSGKVKVSVVIPESLRNADSSITRTYKLIRLHEGQAVAEEVTGTYDPATYTFTFETDRFSTYAIAYKDTKIGGGSSNPGGSGNGGSGNGGSGSGNGSGGSIGSNTGNESDDDSTIIAGNTPSTGNNTSGNAAGSNDAGANASAGSATGTAPKTGDSSAMMMWAVIALVSLAGIVLVYRKKRA